MSFDNIIPEIPVGKDYVVFIINNIEYNEYDE